MKLQSLAPTPLHSNPPYRGVESLEWSGAEETAKEDRMSTGQTSQPPTLAVKAVLGQGPDRPVVGFITTDPGWWCSSCPRSRGRCEHVRVVIDAITERIPNR